MDGQSQFSEHESSSMDHFVSIVDLIPLIMEESACIQFLFDEGLLRIRMRCNECYTNLSPNKHIQCLHAKEDIRE